MDCSQSSREIHGKNWKSNRSPPQSPPRPRIWRPLFMYRERRLACARTGDILACLYLNKATYLWRRELELWQYNDPLWMFTGVRFFEHFYNINLLRAWIVILTWKAPLLRNNLPQPLFRVTLVLSSARYCLTIFITGPWKSSKVWNTGQTGSCRRRSGKGCLWSGEGGWGLPYLTYTGMCRWTGYSF